MAMAWSRISSKVIALPPCFCAKVRVWARDGRFLCGHLYRKWSAMKSGKYGSRDPCAPPPRASLQGAGSPRSDRLWLCVESRPGIKEWQQGKIHHRRSHPLERGSQDFNQLRPKVFWGMAHWIGKKYKVNMPEVMRRYRKGDTLTTKTMTLGMPTEY